MLEQEVGCGVGADSPNSGCEQSYLGTGRGCGDRLRRAGPTSHQDSPGPQLQAPPPGSPPVLEAPSLTPAQPDAGKPRGSPQKSGRKRFPGSLLPLCAQGPRSLDFVRLLGQRLPPEDQEDEEVDSKLHVAKDGDAEAAVEEATQGGPEGAGQWLHGGAEAQHGPCRVGV